MTASAGERIAHALNDTVTLEFTEIPISEAAAVLSKEAGVDVVVSRRALEESGLGVDLPITIALREAPLRSVLHRMLARHDLTWVVRDEAIEITTKDAAANVAVTRAYPVRDIAAMQGDPAVLDVDSLIQTITSSFDAESWEDVGGPGVIREFGGLLAITNHDEVHRQIGSLFAAAGDLQKRRSASPDAPVTEPLPLSIDADNDALRKKVAEARVSLDVAGFTLAEAVEFLEEATKLPFEIETRALEEAGLGGDVAITIKLTDAPLPVALSRMLREVDLTWTVRDGVVAITTPDGALSTRILRIYPVGDLLPADDEPSDRAQGLSSFITSMVERESWQDVGGSGSIVALPTLDALVIVQSDEVHKKIVDLLGQVRSARTAGEAAAADKPEAASQPKTIVYRLQMGDFPPEMAAQLTTMIREFVAPESWSSDEAKGAGLMHVLGGAIVVRQTPEVHREISRMFATINMPVTTQGGFFGLPMGGAVGGMGGGGMGGGGMGGGGMGGGGMGGGLGRRLLQSAAARSRQIAQLIQFVRRLTRRGSSLQSSIELFR
jgi:hypothetical protein